MGNSERRPYHRWFGVVLVDLMADAGVVEIEKDMSLQQQLLDVLIVRAVKPLPPELPDGLRELAPRNLISFKSHQEAFDFWALLELLGSLVAYRKLVSPRGELLPWSEFRLFAVCARRPEGLFALFPPQPLGPGVSDLPFGELSVRVVVVRELPQEPRNAPLLAFSADENTVQYAGARYRPRNPNTTAALAQLFGTYQAEGLRMAYTMADFERDYVLDHLQILTPEQRLAGMPPEQRLAGLSEAEIAALLARHAVKKPAPHSKKPRGR